MNCRLMRRAQTGGEGDATAETSRLTALRDLIGNIAHDVSQAATHNTFDEEPTRLGLRASTSEDAKAQRAESSIAG